MQLIERTVIFLVMMAVIILCMCSCGYNKQVFDLHYNFNYAIIFLPDGSSIEGKVSSWTDFEQSDMIQIKIDGVTYLTHSANVILEER